jgi:hypothetical protein
MEQVLDWLNENELRAYPLMNVPERLRNIPDNLLLDLQLVCLIPLEHDGISVPVYLKSVVTLANAAVSVFFGTFDTDIAVFSIPSVSQAVFPLYVRNSDGSLAVFGEGIKTFTTPLNINLQESSEIDITAWQLPQSIEMHNNRLRLYSTSQTPTDFNCSITGTGHLFLSNVTYCKLQATDVAILNMPVEASTCIQFNDAWLGVNSLRTQPEKNSLPGSYAPALPLEDTSSSTRVTGDIQFMEGYNFKVNIVNNLIDLEISTSYGLKMDCSTSFIPERFLDCHELVSYINGVPPDKNGNFTIKAGSNIDILSGNTLEPFLDPYAEQSNSHTLFVGLSLQPTALCAPLNITPSLV